MMMKADTLTWHDDNVLVFNVESVEYEEGTSRVRGESICRVRGKYE